MLVLTIKISRKFKVLKSLKMILIHLNKCQSQRFLVSKQEPKFYLRIRNMRKISIIWKPNLRTYLKAMMILIRIFNAFRRGKSNPMPKRVIIMKKKVWWQQKRSLSKKAAVNQNMFQTGQLTSLSKNSKT